MKEKTKGINLYQVWSRAHEEGTVKTKNTAKQIVYPLIIFGICAAVYAGLSVWNLAEAHKTAAIEDWINDSQVQEEYSKALAKETESEKLATQLSQVAQMKQNLDTYPDLTEEMLEKIVDVGGNDMSVRVQSLDMSTGTLTFHAVSRKVIDIPNYIQKLDDTGLFDSVNYSGYSYDGGEYSLMLSCVLKAEETGGEQ